MRSRWSRIRSLETSPPSTRAAANRRALARLFAEVGDPKELGAEYDELPKDLQLAMSWHFRAWQTDREGFISARLSMNLLPTPVESAALLRTMWRGNPPIIAESLAS